MNIISPVMLLASIIAGIYVCITVPFLSTTISCYDAGTEASDKISVTANVKGWDARKVCELNFDAINEMNTCLTDARKKETRFGGGEKIIHILLPLIRPNVPFMETQMRDHNVDCAAYPHVQFDLPEPAGKTDGVE